MEYGISGQKKRYTKSKFASAPVLETVGKPEVSAWTDHDDQRGTR